MRTEILIIASVILLSGFVFTKNVSASTSSTSTLDPRDNEINDDMSSSNKKNITEYKRNRVKTSEASTTVKANMISIKNEDKIDLKINKYTKNATNIQHKDVVDSTKDSNKNNEITSENSAKIITSISSTIASKSKEKISTSSAFPIVNSKTTEITTNIHSTTKSVVSSSTNILTTFITPVIFAEDDHLQNNSSSSTETTTTSESKAEEKDKNSTTQSIKSTEPEESTKTTKFSTSSRTSENDLITESSNTTESAGPYESTELTETTTALVPVCEITNMTQEENSSTNRLTVMWEINDAEICRGEKVILNLINWSCRRKCEDEKIECNNCTSSATPRNVTNLTYNFPNSLEGCATYQYEIGFTNLSRNDLQNRTSEEFRSLKKFGNITNLKISNFIDEENDKQLNMKIEWNYNFPECEQTFKIMAVGGGNVREHSTKNQNYTFSNFFACVDYNITVQLDDNANYSVSELFTMSQINPSPIRNFTINQGDRTSIRLDWDDPEFGAKCVKRYVAHVQNIEEEFYLKISPEQKVISDVYACMDYNITIQTCSSDETESNNNLSNNFGTTASSSTTRHFSTPTSDILSNKCNSINVTEAFATASIKTEPRSFLQPQQPLRISSTDKLLNLTVVPSSDVKNKCTVKKYHIQCNSTLDNTIERNAESPNNNVTVDLPYPYHNYSCAASIENEAGKSVYSSAMIFRTEEGVPGPPKVSVRNISSESFNINWQPPEKPNGVIKSYKVIINFKNFSYINPSHCETYTFNDTQIVQGKSNFNFTKAIPKATYVIHVQAVNGAATSDPSNTETVETLEDQPDQPFNFTFIPNEVDINKTYNTSISLVFKYPCYSNGIIKGFNIKINDSNINENITSDASTDHDMYLNFKTDKLEPDKEYTAHVSAYTDKYIGKHSSMNIKVTAGIPLQREITFGSLHSEASTTALSIKIPPNIFDSDVGRITHAKILIAGAKCIPETRRDFIENENNYELTTWGDAINRDCIPLYNTGIILQNSINASTQISVGADSKCEKPNICNGPLKSGTEYGLTFRIYTTSGFSDTNYIKLVTNKEVPIVTISIIILSILCIVFLIGFYISCRRTIALRKQAVDSPYDRKDIAVQNFHAYHSTMIKNDSEKIKEEYKAIQYFSDNLNKTFIASKANEKLNRYLNIYPYDSSRVVLNDDEYENDYINASYIHGYYYPKEYIAAQGPKPNTVVDFWRMVIQHRTESIVMLTSLVENNKIKCHEYFPKLTGFVKHGNMKIVCIEEQMFNTYIKRVFTVEKDDVKFNVNHYYFCKWPDHGCPSNALDLIEFVKTVRNERQKPGETFIVHCSAGVGRTGTFIALDIMMQRIKKEGKINIFDLVKQLRIQRMKMVQSGDQYQFLYTSALELVTMPRNTNVFHNLRATLFKYINEIEMPKNIKWPVKRRSNEQANIVKTDEKETVL